MPITAPLYGLLGAAAGVLFTYPAEGLFGAILAGLVGGIVGYAAGSVPVFGLLTSIGLPIPGFVLVPGTAGMAGFVVANTVL